jgi:hypothetical protein
MRLEPFGIEGFELVRSGQSPNRDSVSKCHVTVILSYYAHVTLYGNL